MDIQFDSEKKELAKIGILDIYIKRKLKDYYSKNFKNINTKQQEKIINAWKKKNSIKSSSELYDYLNLYEINHEDWINLINSDYLWTYWCMDKYKDELTQYFINRKDYLDLYYYTTIKVKNKELADEIYIRLKEKESTFEEISKNFSYDNEGFYAEKIGPISINKMEDAIASLIKIGELKQSLILLRKYL